MTATDNVKVTVVKETEKAYFFEDEEGKTGWFPKSEVSFASRNVKTLKAVAIIPLWLLNEKDW